MKLPQILRTLYIDARMSDTMKPNFVEQDLKRQGIKEQNCPLVDHLIVSLSLTIPYKTYV